MRALILSAALLAVACAGPTAAMPQEPFTASPTAPSPAPILSSARTAVLGSEALGVDSTVAAKLTALIEASEGAAAVVVADGRSGTTVLEMFADEVVPSASLYKLAVLLEAEARIELATLRPTDTITVTLADQRDGGGLTGAGGVITIDEALERMITVSDNPSALALMRTLGVDAIHATLDREGMPGQRFTAHASITTARTIATFFGRLSRGDLISSAASERMLARLSRQKVVDRIPAALPNGVVLGHKTGNLGSFTHDAGLISGPGGVPVVLVVLTWDSTEEAGSQLIRDITAVVYGGLTTP